MPAPEIMYEYAQGVQKKKIYIYTYIYIFPTSDFDGEGAAIEGGGMREEGTLPVEEHLDGEDVPLSQQQQPPDLLVPEETKKNRR